MQDTTCDLFLFSRFTGLRLQITASFTIGKNGLHLNVLNYTRDNSIDRETDGLVRPASHPPPPSPAHRHDYFVRLGKRKISQVFPFKAALVVIFFLVSTLCWLQHHHCLSFPFSFVENVSRSFFPCLTASHVFETFSLSYTTSNTN